MEEIEMLKNRIAELETASGKEREQVVKEVLSEHIENPPEQVPAGSPKMMPEEVKKQMERVTGLSNEADSHQRQIVELLQIVQEKGIANAVSIVRGLNNPHLEDDFHAALINFFKNV